MNAPCERLVGTLRREILDARHLRSVLTEYQAHYNTAGVLAENLIRAG